MVLQRFERCAPNVLSCMGSNAECVRKHFACSSSCFELTVELHHRYQNAITDNTATTCHHHHRRRHHHHHDHHQQPTDRYAPVCSFYPVLYTSLPLALKTSSFALAGSIPTEFGELINLTTLRLQFNKLSGTPSLLIGPGVVVRVYHLR
jgi:hypothetical protein